METLLGHIAKALAGDKTDGGLWAYPIVFLYRHAFELLVKEILTNYGAGKGICKMCVLGRSHNLGEQLPDLLLVAAACDYTISPELENMLNSWDSDHPNGMKARYPMSRKGKETVLVEDYAFDLGSFAKDCETRLDELDELLSNLRDEEYREVEAQALGSR